MLHPPFSHLSSYTPLPSRNPFLRGSYPPWTRTRLRARLWAPRPSTVSGTGGAVSPRLGDIGANAKEKPGKSGLSTQSLAHNSIRLQILPCRESVRPYRQPLTGPHAPVGKCLCKGLSPRPRRPPPGPPRSAGSALPPACGEEPPSINRASQTVLLPRPGPKRPREIGCHRGRRSATCRGPDGAGTAMLVAKTAVCLRTSPRGSPPALRHGHDEPHFMGEGTQTGQAFK